MRCTIVAIGMRGDVQPMLALGAGLKAAGVQVRVATHADFAAAVRDAGLDVAVVQGDAGAFFGGTGGVALRDRLADARAFRRLFDDYLSLFYEKLLKDVAAACEDADVIICWPWTRFAPSLAEAFGVPVFLACPYPPMHLPTAAFANPYQHEAHAHSLRRSWRLALPAVQMGDGPLNRWRQQTLKLAPIGWRQDVRRLRRMPHLLGYSEAVLPRPAEWPASVEITGFWFLQSAGYEPPPELKAFLEAGPAVAIGFSSQVVRNNHALAKAVAGGIAASGVRAVVLSGFGALANLTAGPTMLPMRSVPYEWLFARMTAAVHHGGSGSTGLALQAGVPNAAVPFGYDQPLWGERLHDLGVGPAPIRATDLTADGLARMLTALTTSEPMRQRARELSAAIRAEDGVGRAVAAISSALARRDSPAGAL